MRIDTERLIGDYDPGTPGPTLIAIGGIHGNEPAGPLSIDRVLETLRTLGTPIQGRLFGLRGNLVALERNERYLHRDLNRNWSDGQIRALENAPGDRTLPEDRAQLELHHAIRQCKDAAPSTGPILVLDLHSTSGDGPPFAFLTRSNSISFRMARNLKMPIILGVEEVLNGTLISYLSRQGDIALGVEGGQHTAQETITHLEYILWMAMVAWKMLKHNDVPDLTEQRATLRRAVKGLPEAVEVIYRHPIDPTDGFRMEPGFANFDRVKPQMQIARDDEGPILCRADGRILLPLYQGLGEEGFLIVRKTSSLKLKWKDWMSLLPLGDPQSNLPR